jgi:hypothetical protein
MPERIQRRRTKGWRMPAGAVAVTRPGRFGNPWSVAKAREAGFTGTDAEVAALCVGMFRNGMRAGVPVCQPIIAALPELRGKHLACWCPLDQPCHADVLLALANA